LQQYFSTLKAGRHDLAPALKSLLSAVELYLELGKAGRVPDNGISGFMRDNDGSVYYRGAQPDAGNNSSACAAFLCHCLQQFNWLEGDWIQRLGKGIAVLEELVFDGRHGYCQSLSDQLVAAQPSAGSRGMLVAQLARAIVPPKQRNAETALALSLDDSVEPLGTAIPAAEPVVKTNVQTEGRLAKQLARTEGPRYVALISDIHANYTALDHVLYILSQEGIKQGVVLGDIVGYGPDPKECIARVRETGFTVIKGNHDHAIAQQPEQTGMSQDAQTVINWTKGQLDDADKAWLAGLPPVLENDEWLAVHGAPTDPHYFYGYIHSATSNANLDCIEAQNRQLCIHGHTHLPGAFVRDQGGRTFAL
ncbi:MAG: metallophosphoesterase family protein, partial [Pontibacterium sp.]